MLSRTWIPLVILAVLVVSGFVVYRVHGYFGSEKRESYADSNLENPKPFNPKRIVYEVFGPPGTRADRCVKTRSSQRKCATSRYAAASATTSIARRAIADWATATE